MSANHAILGFINHHVHKSKQFYPVVLLDAYMTSKLSDLQNDLQAPQNRLCSTSYVSEPPSFCLHAPHFYLRLMVIFAGLMAPLHPLPPNRLHMVALVGDYTMKNCNQREVCLIDNFS